MPSDYKTCSYGMLLAALVSVLVSLMIGRSCHAKSAQEVAVNWHDLLKATHTGECEMIKAACDTNCTSKLTLWRIPLISGRIIAAVMTMVLSWRMRDSFVAHSSTGVSEPLTAVLLVAVALSMACTALLIYCHSEVNQVYAEVGRLRRITKGRREW